MNNEIIKFVNGDLQLDVTVSPDNETVWLSQKQMAELFNKDRRTIAVSYMTIINKYNLKDYDFEYQLFDINNIPKMAFDHGDIIKNAIFELKCELLNLNNLKILFPADFTMPELQKICEEILDEKIDRRNFRKKMLPLVEDTNESNEATLGRPAKLYRFSDKNLERSLFNVIK